MTVNRSGALRPLRNARYRSKVSNDDFIPITNRFRTTLLVKTTERAYAAFVKNERFKQPIDLLDILDVFSKDCLWFPQRAGILDVSSHNLRKTFATRLLSRGAEITDVQHLLGHASSKTTERAYAAFVKNERFKQNILEIILKIIRKATPRYHFDSIIRYT